MSLIGPHLVTSLYDIYLPNPIDWDIDNVVGEGIKRTLDGTEVTDVYYRKHVFVLKWETMSVEDYNNLMQVINHQLDRSATITFTWGKWPETATGVAVFARVPKREFKAGKGSTAYYSKVELRITDAANRQT